MCQAAVTFAFSVCLWPSQGESDAISNLLRPKAVSKQEDFHQRAKRPIKITVGQMRIPLTSLTSCGLCFLFSHVDHDSRACAHRIPLNPASASMCKVGLGLLRHLRASSRGESGGRAPVASPRSANGRGVVSPQNFAHMVVYPQLKSCFGLPVSDMFH